MGFQTANEVYKKEVLARNETNQSARKAIENMNHSGIKFSIDHILNLPGETRKDIELSLQFYIENHIREISIYFLNYYPESPITRYAYENGYTTRQQHEKISKCEMIGEQSFKGTILDDSKAKEQVQYALLFRLIDLLPATWVRFIFRKDIYRIFPTNRYFYYFVLILVMLKYRGLKSAVIILYFSIPLISKIGKRK
jgi:radical SAM superfamily enzyme YgiQ (UPF0313 family)